MITEFDVSTRKKRWFSDKVLPQEPLLRLYLRRIAPDGADFEELVQDVYVRALAIKDTKIPHIESTCSFLCVQAHAVVMERLRNTQVVSMDVLSELRRVHAMAPLAPDLDKTRDAREELSQLRSAISHLPQRLQRIMILCKVHGFGVEEIARHMNIPEHKIERQLSEGLRHCATFMFARIDKSNSGPLSHLTRRGARL